MNTLTASGTLSGTLTSARDTRTRADVRHGPGLHLLLGCEHPAAGGARVALLDVDEVTLGRGDARAARLEGRRLDVTLPDRFLSGKHARVVRAEGRVVLQDAGSRNGCLVNGTRVAEQVLRDGDVLQLGHAFWLFRAAQPWPADARAWWEAPSTGVPGMTSLAPGVARDLASLGVAAASTLGILLLGETGTGKEVLARAVHQLSGRAGAFVPVNCGGLSSTLLEGQLFGHVKGAFTGAARDERGLVRASDGGTLFLDEMGDLPLPAQAALLRVLQEREVVPVGGTRAVPVDLRVVAATHRRIDVLAARGDFRADLYARLNGCTHHLVPLRDRREDLGMLLAALLPPARSAPWSFTTEAAHALVRHAWPLNVRELQQALALATTLARDGVMGLEHLPATLREPAPADAAPPAPSPSPRQTVEPKVHPPATPPLDDAALAAHLAGLLNTHRGNVSRVARDMGKTRMQVHRWMKRFGLDPAAYRDGSGSSSSGSDDEEA